MKKGTLNIILKKTKFSFKFHLIPQYPLRKIDFLFRFIIVPEPTHVSLSILFFYLNPTKFILNKTNWQQKPWRILQEIVLKWNFYDGVKPVINFYCKKWVWIKRTPKKISL